LYGNQFELNDGAVLARQVLYSLLLNSIREELEA